MPLTDEPPEPATSPVDAKSTAAAGPAERVSTAGAYWGQRERKSAKTGNAWYYLPAFRHYANRRACGSAPGGYGAGFMTAIAETLGGVPARRAVSIGCGAATREISLLADGHVDFFELYEISGERLEAAQRAAEKKGVGDRISTHLLTDEVLPGVRDAQLVFWCMALHHMSDVHEAVRWSRQALAPGGLFAMYEYVGPTRFQWTKRSLAVCDAIRRRLPDSYFNVADRPRPMPRPTPRVNATSLALRDPSESVDSERIVEAIKAGFDEPDIRPLGGAVYHLVFRGILPNIDQERDAALIAEALEADRALEDDGDYHFAVAFARRR